MSFAHPSHTPTPSRPLFYAFVSDEADLATLRHFAEKQHLPTANVLQGDATTAAEFLQNNTAPTVLFVEVPDAAQAPALLEKLANVCDPDTKVIVIGTVNEYSFYCWLMELGVSSYLLRPLSVSMLEGAWTKAMEPPATAAGGQAKAPAEIIGVLGARGGVGATSISVLLTALLAKHPAMADKKVLIADLDPQDGSVALLLDIEPSRGLREALEKPDRIDNLFLDRAVHRSEHGFYVLSAEESLAERVQYHDQAATTLIAELRQAYDLIVLDLPRHVNPFARGCMKECKEVYIISELTLPGMRDCLRLADLFRDSLKLPPPVFIGSRVGMAPKFEMGAGDFSKALNSDLKHRVPFAPDVFMTLSAELEPLKHPDNAAIKVLKQLATEILGEAEEAEKQAAENKLAKWLPLKKPKAE